MHQHLEYLGKGKKVESVALGHIEKDLHIKQSQLLYLLKQQGDNRRSWLSAGNPYALEQWVRVSILHLLEQQNQTLNRDTIDELVVEYLSEFATMLLIPPHQLKEPNNVPTRSEDEIMIEIDNAAGYPLIQGDDEEAFINELASLIEEYGIKFDLEDLPFTRYTTPKPKYLM